MDEWLETQMWWMIQSASTPRVTIHIDKSKQRMTVVELSMSYHNPVVGANGQRQAMFLENVQGFGQVLWRNFAVTPDDSLLAISSSGCNAVTIDVAIEARRAGMFVAALTSLATSTKAAPQGTAVPAANGSVAGALLHGVGNSATGAVAQTGRSDAGHSAATAADALWLQLGRDPVLDLFGSAGR